MDTLGLSTDNKAILSGSTVPIASPSDPRTQLAANHPVILKVAADSNAVVANIGRHLDLPSAPQINGRVFKVSDKVANGSPEMVFAISSQTPIERSTLALTRPTGQGYQPLGDIRKANRDYRLKPFNNLGPSFRLYEQSRKQSGSISGSSSGNSYERSSSS
ncbi:MAG: hypothetical protein M1839_006334 [Geoglossum umbratile]|nr:MAG: hypothetical protein M1839_006334 [Geoglossum umbratile]